MAQASLPADLQSRAAENRPVTVGLAVAGQMGTDIVVQTALMPGLRIGAISEIAPDAAIARASGWYVTVDEPVAAMVPPVERIVEPGPELVEICRQMLAVYRDIYPATRDIQARLAELGNPQ